MPGIRPIPEPLTDTIWGAHRGDVAHALEALEAGPEPSPGARRLARLLSAAPGLAEAALHDPDLATRAVAVCGSSRALTDIAVSLGDEATDALSWAEIPQPEIARDDRGLSRAVARHLLGIAALDLSGKADMPRVGGALADLADAAAAATLDLVRGDVKLAVVALGKWGGRELNYASDIDLVLVHEGDGDEAIAASVRFMEILSGRTEDGFAFRVDADLRPEGSAGPLSRTLDSYRAYWERWARTWEFQALLKARPAAGDIGLAEAFVAAAEPFVYPDTLGAEAVREIRASKGRAESQRRSGDELKRGVGGIRDVEFAVQLLQLVHGRSDPALRSANTLEVLNRLGEGGYVRGDDAESLGRAYRWLRDVEHRLQLRDLRQTHTVPARPAAREALAKTMGYRDGPKRSAAEAFEEDLVATRTEVRNIHERLFYRPLLEELASRSLDRSERQLVALGFTESDAALAAMRELTAGLSRRSRLMQQMLPLMLGWLSDSPDPDLGLAQLRRLVADATDNAALTAALRDDPLAAERLCRLLGTARVATRLLDRVPAALPMLGDDDRLREADPLGLFGEAAARARLRKGDAVATLNRFWGENLLRTVVADTAGLLDSTVVGRRLSDTADALVRAALEDAASEVATRGAEPPLMAVVALGKWGGRELNYASDLDALIVHRGDDEAAAAQVAEGLLSHLEPGALGIPPPRLDLDLRPEGRKGAIVRSLGSFEAYWEQWAEPWEFQALLRARPVAGDANLGADFLAAARRRASPESIDPGWIRQVRAMKARVEAERIPIGEDPDFHVKLGKGGMADVEWTVQLLQMRHGNAHPGIQTPSTLGALDAMAAEALVSEADAEALRSAYTFCAAVRNRLWLRAGRSRDSLPADQKEAAIVARSLGYEIAPRSALREEYRRLTRRARRVAERLFFAD